MQFRIAKSVAAVTNNIHECWIFIENLNNRSGRDKSRRWPQFAKSTLSQNRADRWCTAGQHKQACNSEQRENLSHGLPSNVRSILALLNNESARNSLSPNPQLFELRAACQQAKSKRS